MTGDIFGGLFDFNFDGKTDAFELALGLNMIEEEERKSQRFGRSHSSFDDDLDDLDDFDDLSEFDPDDF